eukprot:gnl/TRDRNA2_/TRDRNA2_176294_c0_seq1.p1 gnl/TRDRNA2_/TRDRNA2_176294_c0~~gnl/TRDRNA2_/TRDRNA2_176294_c0_seq1.p1  ORF type:complete len:222 (+),score=4.03 gnl/TRDRNA2_/TRDRNA2_176294_c0_seq1:328-993(+)
MWARYQKLHQNARHQLEQGTHGGKGIVVWRCQSDQRGRKKSCGGLGDMIRGLSFMLYVSMILNRPFFVDWHQLGLDILDMYAQTFINVRLPEHAKSGLEGVCKHVTYAQKHKEFENGHAVLRGISHNNCTIVYTNVSPDGFLAKPRPTNEHEIAAFDEIRKLAKPGFYTGCAMNFMFSPSPLYFSMLESAVPKRYVSIHLRFGDKTFVEAVLATSDKKKSG